MPARAVRVALGAIAALTVPAVLAATPAAAAARKPPPGYRIVHTAVLTLPANSRFSGEVTAPPARSPGAGAPSPSHRIRLSTWPTPSPTAVPGSSR
jgi:hypothetical protein